jgi:hypothetical protein
MPAVLRVSGPYDKLRHSLLATPFAFQEAIALRTARERGVRDSGRSYAGQSTFSCTVSDADGDHVPVQIEETARFLSDNTATLQTLRTSDGVEHIAMDFSWNFPTTSFAQYNRFSHALLGLCSALAIDLEVSVYLVERGLPLTEDSAGETSGS